MATSTTGHPVADDWDAVVVVANVVGVQSRLEWKFKGSVTDRIPTW